MSVRKLLEDLDIETMDDEVVIDDNIDVVDDVANRLFVTDEEGNLISAHIYANEILLTYELTEEELMNLLKESGEAFKFFTFTLEGVDELVIGNELCTIEDIKNQFLSSLEDGEELEFDVVEIKDEKDDTTKKEPQLPIEEQLREGWNADGSDFIYYCISDGMNPRNSVIIPDGEGARERAIEIGKNNPNFKYVSMFKNGDEIVIWHSDDFDVKGMKVEEAIKEGPDNIFGYINGDLESFDPKAFIEKVKERKTSLHTNRMIKDTDDVKVCHHIVCETLGWGDEPKVWVDVVEETWTRNPGDADDINSYYGTETQDRILMEKCGKGEEGFAKAIEVLEKYKKDTLAKKESLKESGSHEENISKIKTYSGLNKYLEKHPELFLKSTGKGSLGVFKEVDGIEEFVCEVDRFYRPFHKEVKKADLKIVKEEQEDPREKFKKDNAGFKFYELYCEPNEEIKYDGDNFSIIIRMPIEEPKPTQEEAELFLGDKLNVDGKQYHVVGIWEDEGGSVFDPFENAEYIIDYAKPQTILASATKEEVKNEGAEGKKVPGKEWVIYDASEDGKAPIVAIRKTYVEAQYYCTRHFGDDLGIEEVPVGRFKVGDDFYGPFDQDWNLIED